MIDLRLHIVIRVILGQKPDNIVSQQPSAGIKWCNEMKATRSEGARKLGHHLGYIVVGAGHKAGFAFGPTGTWTDEAAGSALPSSARA